LFGIIKSTWLKKFLSSESQVELTFWNQRCLWLLQAKKVLKKRLVETELTLLGEEEEEGNSEAVRTASGTKRKQMVPTPLQDISS